MPRKSKDGQPFDQKKYVNEWSKENMALVGARYKKEFVEEYKTAAKQLGLRTSDLIRQMMLDVIEQAKQK